MANLVTLLSGLLFGAGLAVSGMINPAKVLNFLDFSGTWDPTLGFVMGGALLVSVPAFWLARRKDKPYFADLFRIPDKTGLDAKLVTGAALFGIGWGLAGFCPGPALAALATGNSGVLVFALAMLAGMALHRFTEKN